MTKSILISGIRKSELKTVVQPDIVVICDQNKLDKRGCLGAPDIAVEILSSSTFYKDQTEKLLLYEKHGVKEYWQSRKKSKLDGKVKSSKFKARKS